MDSKETRTSTPYLKACSSFVLVILVAITLQVFFLSPISPDPLQIPPTSHLPTNNQLQTLIKLGEGLLNRPEDLCVDGNGIIYAATVDGWIRKLHRNGSWEDWRWTDSDGLLGITTTRSGSIIVCDVNKGLLRVDEDGVTVLTSHVNGTKIRFADDVIEAPDGSLYFSVASSKYTIDNYYLDLLEAKPHGQLLKYDPLLKETSVVLDGLYFANGVAVSADQNYLVVCETWKSRCLKYWLSGEHKGKTEVFVDNLPGGPDNINLAPDGTYWIALHQLTLRGFEFVHNSKAIKHLLATFPSLFHRVNGMHKKATVVNVGTDGKIIKKFDDPTGEVINMVTSGLEFEDHLYLGSITANFVGKLPLNAA